MLGISKTFRCLVEKHKKIIKLSRKKTCLSFWEKLKGDGDGDCGAES
jgi:hypothetical protein